MIEASATRHAIMGWRDEASLSAMALVHQAAATAMRTLEERLDTIALADAVVSAEIAARTLLRPAMRLAIGSAADHWFTAQAQALRRVDARLEPLALRFSARCERPPLPGHEGEAGTGRSSPKWLRGSAETFGSVIERAAGVIAERALPDAIRTSAERLSARIGHEVGERSGAHERLRAGARAELIRVWLGPAARDATPRPYLTQLLDTVDAAARAAGESTA